MRFSRNGLAWFSSLVLATTSGVNTARAFTLTRSDLLSANSASEVQLQVQGDSSLLGKLFNQRDRGTVLDGMTHDFQALNLEAAPINGTLSQKDLSLVLLDFSPVAGPSAGYMLGAIGLIWGRYRLRTKPAGAARSVSTPKDAVQENSVCLLCPFES